MTKYDVVLTILSAVTYVADIGTDLWLLVYLFLQGETLWAVLTLTFVALGTLAMQIFSFCWQVADRTLCWKTLILHMVFLAPLYRYYSILRHGLQSRHNKDYNVDAAYREMNDVCILRLIGAFLESAPQLFLQTYIIAVQFPSIGAAVGVSIVFSLLSFTVSLTAYTDGLHLAYKKHYKRSWMTMTTHTLWQIGMIASRTTAVALFASVFHAFVYIPMGVHLMVMMVWIRFLKPDFGTSACERGLFTFITALIHTVCFLPLKSGQSRWRMLTYYTLCLIESSILITLWYLYQTAPDVYDGLAFGIVYGGFATGVACLTLYHGCCHPSGPAPLATQEPEFHQTPASSHRHQHLQATPVPPCFDVSVPSARINLWLNASLDLSRNHLDGSKNCSDRINKSPYTSLLSPSDQGVGNHDNSLPVYTLPNCSVDHSSQSPGGASSVKPMFGAGHPNFIPANSEDRIDYLADDKEAFNLSQHKKIVEMFEKCRLDPAYVSNSSLNDSVFCQDNSSSALRQKSALRAFALTGSPSPTGQLSDRSGQSSNTDSDYRSKTSMTDSRLSNQSHRTSSTNLSPALQFSPLNISPLDPSKLWEESQGRITMSTSLRNDLSDKGESRRFNSRLVSSSGSVYGDTENVSSGKLIGSNSMQSDSALSLSVSSFVFQKGDSSSKDSVGLYYSPVSGILSFSDSSLPLPDSSDDYSHRGKPKSVSFVKNDSLLDRRSHSQTPNRRPSSDMQSSLSLSDRGLSSASSGRYNSSYPSLTSSGFQSEESNWSGGLPVSGGSKSPMNTGSQYMSTPVLENELSTISSKPFHRKKVRESGDYDLSPVVLPPYSLLSRLQSVAGMEVTDECSPVLPPICARRKSSGSSGSSRFFKDPTLPVSETHSISPSENTAGTWQPSDTMNYTSSQFTEKSSLSAYLSEISSGSRTTGVRSSIDTLSTASADAEEAVKMRGYWCDEKGKSLSSLPAYPDCEVSSPAGLPVRPNSCLGRYQDLSGYRTYGDPSEGPAGVARSHQVFPPPVWDCPWRQDYLQQATLLCEEQASLLEMYTMLSEVSSVRCSVANTVESTEEWGAFDSSERVDDLESSPPRLGRSVDLFNRDAWRASLDKEMKNKLVADLQAERLAPRKLYQLKAKNQPSKLSPVTIAELTESPYKFRRNARIDDESKDRENSEKVSSAKEKRVEKSFTAPRTGFLETDIDASVSKSLAFQDEIREESEKSSLCVDSPSVMSPVNTSGVNSAFRPVKPRRKSLGTPTGRKSGSDTFTVYDESLQSSNSCLGETFDKSSSKSGLGGSTAQTLCVNSNFSGKSPGAVDSSVSYFVSMSVDTTIGSNKSSHATPRNYLKLVGKNPINFSAVGLSQHENISKHSCSDSIPWDEQTSCSVISDDSTSYLRQPLRSMENTPAMSPIYQPHTGGQVARRVLDVSHRKRLMSTPKAVSGSTEMRLQAESVRNGGRRRSSGVGTGGISGNDTSTWSSVQDYSQELSHLEQSDKGDSVYI